MLIIGEPRTIALEADFRAVGAVRLQPARKFIRRHSARVALGAGFLALVVLMLGFALVLEVKSDWRDPEYGHRLERLRSSEQKPLVLVLGTSRTQNAIQPASMRFEGGSPRVFNFGQSGATPIQTQLTLLRLLEEGIHPEAVLVELLPVWLAMDESVEAQFEEKLPHLSHRDLVHLERYCEHRSKLSAQWFAARASPWSRHRVSLMSHWLPSWLPWQKRIAFEWQTMDPDGFVPFLYGDPPLEFRSRVLAQARAQFQQTFGGFQLSALSLKALADLVSTCREQGIAVAFFEPPTAPTFRGWFSPGVWEQSEDEIAAFAKGMGTEFFLPPAGYQDSDFADGHHMLRGTAERYSQWFTRVAGANVK